RESGAFTAKVELSRRTRQVAHRFRRHTSAFTVKAELSLRTPRRWRVQTVEQKGAPHCFTRQKAGLRPAVHTASAKMRDLRLSTQLLATNGGSYTAQPRSPGYDPDLHYAARRVGLCR